MKKILITTCLLLNFLSNSYSQSKIGPGEQAIQRFVDELSRIKNALSDLQKEFAEYRASSEREKSELKRKNRRLESVVRNQNDMIENLNAIIVILKNTITQQDGRINELENRIANIRVDSDKTQDSLQTSQGEVARLIQKIRNDSLGYERKIQDERVKYERIERQLFGVIIPLDTTCVRDRRLDQFYIPLNSYLFTKHYSVRRREVNIEEFTDEESRMISLVSSICFEKKSSNYVMEITYGGNPLGRQDVKTSIKDMMEIETPGLVNNILITYVPDDSQNYIKFLIRRKGDNRGAIQGGY